MFYVRFTQIAIEKSVASLMNLRSGMSLSFTFIFLEMEFKSDTQSVALEAVYDQ